MKGFLIPYPCTAHTWGAYNGPIPAVATRPPVFYYCCTKCKLVKSSRVKIPLIAAQSMTEPCQHEYASDASLGAAYECYQVCAKCGSQKVSE